jgi:large subunit ribosomal protein L17
MKHLHKTKKFHRDYDQRRALVRALAHSLIVNGRVITTTERAKYTKQFVERWLTKAKQQDLSQLRYLLERLPKNSSYKLFYEIAPRYKNRPGGYLRLVKLPIRRRGDGAKLSLIEFV